MLAFVAVVSNCSHLKILSPKQILQRLPMALAQLQAGNTFKQLLNEICQIHSLYQAKEITIKVYNNIMNAINLQSKMDTIFMNSENSETEDNLLPYRLLLILEDKIKIK